jgi:hypothetical protein
MEASPEKTLDNLVYVLTDGVPNTGQNAETIGAADSPFRLIFPLTPDAAAPKTTLALVLFGAAAANTNSYPLKSFFAVHGEVMAAQNMATDRGLIVKQLDNGGCIEPPWATVFFENGMDHNKLYDYASDNRVMWSKLAWWENKVKEAGAKTLCPPDATAEFYIAGFASAKSSSAANNVLSEKRAKHGACGLAKLLIKRKCTNFAITTGSFGESYAGKRETATVDEQKVDRNIRIYYTEKYIQDFESFKKGTTHRYVKGESSWDAFDKYCKTTTNWQGTFYWDPDVVTPVTTSG